MTFTPSPLSKSTPPIQYPLSTTRRADRAVRCTAFRYALFDTMRHSSVELKAIAGRVGVANGFLWSNWLPRTICCG
jgi:hypothetical protein